MSVSHLLIVRLLTSIARPDVDDLDTLAEDERDARSEESGVDSLHMSSDESDTEERTEKVERVVETLPSSLPTSLSASSGRGIGTT